MVNSNFSVAAVLTATCLFSSYITGISASQISGQCATSRYARQPRALIATDMSNEPDDQMSLVRLLTYANEINITTIAGITSNWKNDSIDLDTIKTVIGGYGTVVDSLNANLVYGAIAYPTSDELLGRVRAGWPVYGLAALDQDEISDAAKQLIQDVDESSISDPQYVLLWGGANVLAEALHYVTKNRISSSVDEFVSKVRVYSISDQDNAGIWIRSNYPKIFYVVSLQGMNEYIMASWNGISGEKFRHFDQGGPDSSIVTNEWLDEHIRFGPLGAHYPQYQFIMEGDTPSYFPLIQNGLGDPEHPEWGSWGGRFTPQDISGLHRVYADTADYVRGQSGNMYYSSFATIWRWRQAYQYDFAARMQWTTTGFNGTNHAPVAVVNGTCGPEALKLNYRFGDSVVLDASESWDPDGDDLSFHWLHYREVVQRLEGQIDSESKNVSIESLNDQGSQVSLTPLSNITMHIILQVQDTHEINITTYRRVILDPIE
ncbi:hypothetical protein TruAng_000710 [Truncatella angustata]|nr:hypothetical protein TruAng_000710 [Truncatella angustata]